jgi:hypothetical protein
VNQLRTASGGVDTARAATLVARSTSSSGTVRMPKIPSTLVSGGAPGTLAPVV